MEPLVWTRFKSRSAVANCKSILHCAPFSAGCSDRHSGIVVPSALRAATSPTYVLPASCVLRMCE